MLEYTSFVKKEALPGVFSCEFCKFSKNTFSYRTSPEAAFVFLMEIKIKIYLNDFPEII